MTLARPVLAAILLAAAACSQAPPDGNAAAPQALEGWTARGPVAAERVVDGDTLLLSGGLRVRILGIDAPEMRHENPVARRLAREARAELARRVEGRSVVLLVGTPATDRFGRTLAYVELPGEAGAPAQDVGAALVASGHALTYPAAHPRQEAYRELQRGAREARIGLWAPEGRDALDLDVVAETDALGASGHLGRRIRVTDVARRASRTRHGLFVELGTTGALRVVVFPSQLPLFPDDVADRWRGRRLAITGVVRTHRGRPEIVVDDPDQVEPLAP